MWSATPTPDRSSPARADDALDRLGALDRLDALGAADARTTTPPSDDPGSTTGITAGNTGETTTGRRRPSRWDRPPEPHDWRWVVGGIGRILIAVGVLMFAFVGYQLWGTGIQTAQAQNRLEDEFTELLETAAPATSPPSEPAASSVPSESVPATSVATDPATESTTPASTVPPPVLSPPPLGDPLARLEIPAIGLDKIVISGVRPSDLEDGPGHFPETPLPGQLGNSAIAGHRTTHGQPFIRIDEVQVGDDIVVTTIAGGRYVYVMTGQQIVSPNDYQLVIPTVDPSVATLTLTSCHPKYSARQRIVVTAVLDVDRSDPVTLPWTAGVPDQPATEGVIPGDGSPATTAPAAPASTATAATVPATTAAGEPGTVTEDTTGDAPAGADGQELFENRWFSDPDAFPQVALWGVALVAVALGATALSRRVRRNWVGALVGFVPFVVVLYFWFENVNRLLPPNL